MFEQMIHINEHKPCHLLTIEELISLLKEPNELIETIDLQKKYFKSSYYIGLNWLADTGKTLYVTPKLNSSCNQIDYLRMLSESLKHPEIIKHGDDLFKIEFEKPVIKINQQQDLITPLIIIYFLQVVQIIVRKGLKHGYYKIENNFYGKVKGKVLVSQTLKKNNFKCKNLNTMCSFEEYGLNHIENRIIKKALIFLKKYLKMSYNKDKELNSVLNFILPAFSKINENVSINEVKSIRHNPFYSEYSKATELAIIILKRFGFNINLINENEEIEVPPFWINMPKLFELFVLSKLKEAVGKKDVIFQFDANYGNLDFLRITKGKEIVIDAKYKPQYKNISYDIEDIRQLSAYARDKGTLRKLNVPKTDWSKNVLNCLIIFPDQSANSALTESMLLENSIDSFEKFYKMGIAIPEVTSNDK